ncbi:hypothetical protein HLV35_02095 [Eggerthellaceae bacterium zg-997]|nr:hypothetical protein [Eggerthellaceae bacterium zg-997]
MGSLSACAGRLRRIDLSCSSSDRHERGQMTVELAVTLPVAIVLAVIAFNALSYMGSCALFDRAFHQEVRVQAISPARGDASDGTAQAVRDRLRSSPQLEGCEVDVEASRDQAGLMAFEGRLGYRPTLFGLGLADEVFGVRLPRLEHRCAFTVDAYRPGGLL